MTVYWRHIGVFCVAVLWAMAFLASSSAVWGQPAGDVNDGDPDGVPYAAGELLVTFEREASPEAVEAVGRSFGVRVEERIPRIDVRLLEFPEVQNERSQEVRERNLARIKEALERNPAVEAADYNYLVETASTPNDSRFDRQWGMRKIGAPAAWDTSDGAGADIAVLDTGIDSDHPDLQGKIGLQRNFVASPETDAAEDDEGHGTHVAGIAAAETDNAMGVAGACPGCTLLVGKVLNKNGKGYLFDIIDGIVWAVDPNGDDNTDDGAEVINLSLGSGRGAQALEDAIDYAWAEGVVVVAAAGNGDTNQRRYPAAYATAIAAAATNKKDKRASFSNYGSWIDVSAPGTEITSTYRGGGYKRLSGTSMSTPHVAGLAGLLAAQGRSAPQIRGVLESTAADKAPAGKDKFHGWGRISAAAGVSCTIVGSPQNDDLPGTDGDDVICGLGGSDTIPAGDGNDVVWAGPGDDVVRGSNGRDRSIGGAGEDRLFGGAERDRLNGKDGVRGNDRLSGGAGRDRCAADRKDTLRSC